MIEKSKFTIGLREKIVILGLQIALPFVLYLAIDLESLPLGIGAGVFLAMSMLVLVVFG